MFLYAYIGWVKVAENEGERNDFQIFLTLDPEETECGVMSAELEVKPRWFRFSGRYRRASWLQVERIALGKWLGQEGKRPYPYSSTS